MHCGGRKNKKNNPVLLVALHFAINFFTDPSLFSLLAALGKFPFESLALPSPCPFLPPRLTKTCAAGRGGGALSQF